MSSADVIAYRSTAAAAAPAAAVNRQTRASTDQMSPRMQYVVTPTNVKEPVPEDVEVLVFQLPDAQQLPDIVQWESLKSLQHLDLSGCSSLKQLPIALSRIQSLRSLTLGGMHESDSACKQLEFLPESLGSLTTLQRISLCRCQSLKQLPESFGALRALQQLDLRGCSSLLQLPSHIGNCISLKQLQLAGCAALCSLPASLGNCKQLQQLNIQHCSRLRHLPSTCSRLTALQQFDCEGCPAYEGLSQQLHHASQSVPRGQPAILPKTVGNPPASWSHRICACWPTLGKMRGCNQKADQGSGYELLRSALLRQRHRNAVVKLATEQEPMLTTLERMSWLVVLLATATFVAFTMPPGGYGDNQQVLSSNTGACAAWRETGVDENGISNSAFQQCAMLLFFIFDGLSFGLSLGCVMMIVVLSMPRIQWESEKAEAGRFYLLLSVTWFLLYAAVVTGFASFIAAGLSVNRQVKVVIGPVVPGMLLLVIGGVLLCYRFWCLAPGWDAIWESLSFHNQEVKDVCEIEKGQELFWRYWNKKLGSNSDAAAGGDSALDVELQQLLPPRVATH